MTDQITKTATIPAFRALELKAKVEKLAKKARRYGNEDIAVSFGEPYTAKVEVSTPNGYVKKSKLVVDLIITGSAPRVGNYEFLAKIERTEAGNIVDKLPGAEIDSKWQTTDGSCDHCHTERARKLLYIVRNVDTGEERQIGRSCLRDFLGMDDPKSIAYRFGFFSEIDGLDDFSDRSPRTQWFEDLHTLLSWANTCVRVWGWCSKGQAMANESNTATIHYVDCLINSYTDKPSKEIAQRIRDEHNEKDDALATTVIEWVRNEFKDEGDYPHNLRVLFSDDNVASKRTGFVVSAIAAYHRAIEKDLKRQERDAVAAKSEWVGEIKERITGIHVTKLSAYFMDNQWGGTTLTKFIDKDGNGYCWFGVGCDAQNGEEMIITATIKAHNEFKGNKETAITRVKVEEIIVREEVAA